MTLCYYIAAIKSYEGTEAVLAPTSHSHCSTVTPATRRLNVWRWTDEIFQLLLEPEDRLDALLQAAIESYEGTEAVRAPTSHSYCSTATPATRRLNVWRWTDEIFQLLLEQEDSLDALLLAAIESYEGTQAVPALTS